MLATFDSVPQSSRCGTQENSGGGALARCFRLHMVPLSVQYLQNTALWDQSSSYLNACKVITRSLSPRIPRCLSSIIFCATSRVAAVVYQPQPKHLANADGLAIDFHPRTSWSVHTLRLQFIDVNLAIVNGEEAGITAGARAADKLYLKTECCPRPYRPRWLVRPSDGYDLDLRSLGSGPGEGLKPLRDFITASEFEPA